VVNRAAGVAHQTQALQQCKLAHLHDQALRCCALQALHMQVLAQLPLASLSCKELAPDALPLLSSLRSLTELTLVMQSASAETLANASVVVYRILLIASG